MEDLRDDTLNGVKIVGARPYSVFEKAIKDILATQTGAKSAK